MIAVIRLEQRYIYPKTYNVAPDDSGNSIGATLYLSKNILKTRSLIKNINNPYLGMSFEDNSILKIIKKYKISFKKSKNITSETAQLLSDGKIIGWFQGRSEFGQRALGNRSILANPKINNMKKILNEAVKYREGFRPFAPSIIEEKFINYFESREETSIPFMEKIYYLKKQYRDKLNSICHKDGSCRVQTVSKKNNSLFYRLLVEFEKKEKVPILINTSFNIKGEPIVDNIENAISTFYRSGLDVLIVGNYLIKK